MTEEKLSEKMQKQYDDFIDYIKNKINKEKNEKTKNKINGRRKKEN